MKLKFVIHERLFMNDGLDYFLGSGSKLRETELTQ
jgi:hypothetical protein